ncbi:Na+/H+ antiporter NhaD/arsenite permease-like protein [Rhodoligotrophos appendicifer]|uniref:SLC13 family permease n=1 Tax=Rhodoligotrophos appendicifer TaxID=987056 RepID=UPI001185650D|nr:SLC13 family permease [Rhodoligotrophos appendicifer]
MTSLVVAIFCLVYLGMAVGRIPGLRVDRTGIALLGLAVLIVAGGLSLPQAASAIDLPTIILLFALMVLSAQLQMSGFYALCGRAVTRSADNPVLLLAAVIGVAGGLSAVLTNDVVVFALTPLLCMGLRAREMDPRPFLIGLAGAANAGSAATLIGNPQNILIGEVGDLDFWWFALYCAPLALVSLVIVLVAVLVTWPSVFSRSSTLAPEEVASVPADRWEVAKGLASLALLVGLFATDMPREVSALGIAAIILLSRKRSSRDVLAAVDWQLLLLFICLFGVTAAFSNTGLATGLIEKMAELNLLPERLSVMAPISLVLSNTIGNVPAVVLITTLIPDLGSGPLIALSLLSTLAGNLLLTGSIANIIVAERARSHGVTLSFADFARSGILMTAVSFAAAIGWLLAIGIVAM